MYDAAERRNVPTEQRGVSMVFQSYAVWPHMTVLDNVAYGLRVRKQSRAEIKANVERALDLDRRFLSTDEVVHPEVRLLAALNGRSGDA